MASQTTLQIVLKAKDEASGKLKGVSKSMGGLKNAVSGLLPIIGAAGLGFAIKGVIKDAAAFEQQLSDISTLIDGDATKAVKGFEKGIQSLAKTIPKDPKELGAAAYQIVSAGITDTSDALKVLNASAKLGVAGLGTTEEATNLLTSALNAFKIPVEDAEKAASVLFNTVKQGKTTVRQLAVGFGQVVPIAAEMGVTLEELSAATAALTTTGLKTSVAQQQLRAAMASLLKPTADAKELFDKLGVESFKQLIERSGGLVGAFEKLKESSAGNEEQLAKAAGSIEGLSAILSLTGAQADTFKASLDSMTTSTTAFDEAVQKQNSTAIAQWQILKNKVNVEFQKLALQILPILTEVMIGLPDVIDTYVIKPFSAVVDVLGTVIFKIDQAIQAIKRFKDTSTGTFLKKAGGVALSAIAPVTSTIKDILPFAKGGIVTSPTLGLVGEAGPEAVIPLNKAGGLGGVNVNIMGGMFLSQEAAEQMGDLIIDKLKTNIRI